MSAPLLYPFSLGMLAAVNPCGFPLLPAYLELFVGGAASDHADSKQADSERAGSGRSDRVELGMRASRAVTAGAFCTLGFVAVFGLLGLLAGVGWSAIYGHSVSLARYLMVLAGVSMVVIGGASLLRKPLRLRLPEIRSGLGLRRPAALAVFGVSYAVASIGCALPLFIGGVSTSFTHGASLTGSIDLVCYALGMGAVLSALALAVAVAGPAAARPLRRLSRFVPTVGALVVILIGAYLVDYWLTAIISPTSSSPAERWVLSWQARLASAMDSHAVLIGSILGAVVVAAILIGGLQTQRRSRPEPASRTVLPSRPRETHPA